MLHHHLQSAIDDLNSLIAVTSQDIEDIKQAKHQLLSSRNKIKEELILAFENKKAVIDREILKLTQENPRIPLKELIDEQALDLLGEMRKNLEKLKDHNKRYARMVLAVSEFYNSLLERLLPSENHGYQGIKRPTSSFLRVEV